MKPKEAPRVILAPTPETDAAFDLRHTKTCTIAHFRQVMEKMERERDEAKDHVANLEVSLTAAIRSANARQEETEKAQAVTKAKPKFKDIPCVIHPIVDVQETEQEEQP
jgi:hypothetical protein